MPEPASLSADALFQLVRRAFNQVPEHRPMNVEVSLADALMSGFALFALKAPSLLAFDERRAKAEVVPLYPEPIIKQAGATQNACERNAAKRFLAHLRADDAGGRARWKIENETSTP